MNNINLTKRQIQIVALWWVGTMLLNIGIRGFWQAMVITSVIQFIGLGYLLFFSNR